MTATGTVIRYERPPLAKYQLDAIFCDERYSLIEASTKAGKTVGCLAWIIEQALQGKQNYNYWWIAPVYPQADIAFRRLKHNLTQGIFKANESDLSLTFRNGARLICKSGEKPDNLYGEDVFAAVVDEASRLREESWFALRSTLTATRAPVRIIGNVKGRKNWFYKMARKAEAGEPNMHYAKITAHDAIAAGVLATEEIEDARRTLPKEVFDELYLAIPTEDGSNPFGYSDIQGCIRPMSTAAPVRFGLDLAKSVDWTVVIGLDANGKVCRFERFQKSWRDTIWTIQNVVGKVPCLVDSTGVGDPVLEELQKGFRNFEGFKFTSSSKQQIMEGLAVAIQQRAIGFPDGVIVHELESFEYEYTRTGVRYSAIEGTHDDCVCALALANDYKPKQAAQFYSV
jgi:phage FluMu gp28-like protein